MGNTARAKRVESVLRQSTPREGPDDAEHISGQTLHTSSCVAIKAWVDALEARGIKLIIGLSTDRDGVYAEQDTGSGILAKHEYSLIRLIQVPKPGYPVLALVRNPWGKGIEWRGDWSDKSGRWTEEMMQLVGYRPANHPDGEFVMSLADVQQQFDKWEINYLYPDDAYRKTLSGSWVGTTAAGCGNVGGRQQYLRNPQFALVVPPPPVDGLACNALFVLTQEDVRFTRHQRTLLKINLKLVSSFNLVDTHRIDDYADELESSGPWISRLAVAMPLHGLQPGSYVVIPSTFKIGPKGKSTAFKLSVVASYPVTLKELH